MPPVPAPRVASSPEDRRTVRWMVAGLIVVNLLIYMPLRYYSFVSFDTDLYVTGNVNIWDGLTWRAIEWAFTTDRGGYWIPITWLSHILDVELFGLTPGPTHVTNIVFHIANTLLLFGLLRRLTGALWQSVFVAALFAVHPLHVEPVAWVAERKGLVSTFLEFLMLWAYTVYTQRRTLWRYGAVLLLFVLALLAKPMVVTAPLILLLLDFWPLRRARLERGEWHRWSRLILEKVPFLVFALASTIITILFHRQQGGLGTIGDFPVGLRAGNALASYTAYLVDLVWPLNLALFYPFASEIAWKAAVSGALLLTISGLVIWSRKEHPYLLTGWFWYLATLAPVTGVLQAGLQSRADRFAYTAVIGIFVVVAWGFPHLVKGWRHRNIALATAAALLIGALGVAARVQLGYWENQRRLWRHAAEVTEDNYVAYNMIGAALADEGRYDEAIEYYRRSLQIQPDYAYALNNLGIALSNQGKIDAAVAQFRETVRVGGNRPDFLRNLGLALVKQGNTEEAMARFADVLRMKPNDAATYTHIGDVLYRSGQTDLAISQYREALHVQPAFARAHVNLGVALANRGDYDQAIVHYTQAIRLQPTLAEAHNGLGVALAAGGRYGEALPHFQEAVRLQPDLSTAHENLGTAMNVLRQTTQSN